MYDNLSSVFRGWGNKEVLVPKRMVQRNCRDKNLEMGKWLDIFQHIVKRWPIGHYS